MLIKKQRGISRGDQEKNMWTLKEFWLFQALKLVRNVTQFCGVSRDEALFCLEFLGVK